MIIAIIIFMGSVVGEARKAGMNRRGERGVIM